MTPTLRTAILDALMERWRESATASHLQAEEPIQREFFASCLDMILPTTEPMIRQDERATGNTLMHELRALCEDTEEKYHLAAQDTKSQQGAYARGRRMEAKSIRNAMSEVYRTLALGEPK